MKAFILLVVCLVIISSCNREIKNETTRNKTTLFELKEDCGVDFQNHLTYTEDFNPYTYRNFYNGGGIAIGDINNDGLLDLYFTGNIVDNRLYLNKGNWQFEDITDKAGVGCTNIWSSGISTSMFVNQENLKARTGIMSFLSIMVI